MCSTEKSFNNEIITLKDFLYVEFIQCRWCFHTSSFVFRSSLLSGYEDIMNNEFKYFPYGDMPTQIWCLLNGNGYLVKEEMSCYRQFSGGYNSYINSHPKKHIEDELSLIKALESFNIYTKYKYSKYIKSRIRRAHIIILSIERSENEFLIETLKPKNWKIIGIRELFKSVLKLTSPRLLDIIFNIKKKTSKYR